MNRALGFCLPALLSLSCSTVTSGSLLSTESAASTSRSFRLDSGFFFGHDVREFSSVVYVLDLSGSMSERTGTTAERMGKDAAADVGSSMLGDVAGDGATSAVLSMDKKVELVKDHLNASLRGLSDGAEFNIVLFSGDVEKLAPTMVTANTATTTAVSAFVSKLKEGGSTNMMRAIEAGLETDAQDVMVLTDGLPTDASPDQILSMVAGKNADKKRRVYTVGVGADQAKDFLSKLAEDNGGEYTAYE